MELPWAESCWAPGEVWPRQPAGGRPCATPCCAAGSVALGSWISAEAWACCLWRREEGLAYSPSSCMKMAVHPLKPKDDTETNKHPKPQPAARPESGLCLDFPGRGSHLVFAGFLKPLLFPRSRESVERMSGSWLATFLTPFHNVCASVKARQSTRDAQPLHPSTGCFSFLLFFFFPPCIIVCGNVWQVWPAQL